MIERTLHRDFYFSEAIFLREKDRIFCREWFCAGREDDVREPGDYLVLDIAGESVLVVRTHEGRLAAHYNVCRHRGSQLVLEGSKGSFAGAIRWADHVTAYTLWPRGPGRTTVACDFLFHPSEVARPEFDPSDAVNFWDLVNQQDWRICENVQRGMRSRVFQFGYYAPIENASLDIRRYIEERLG